MSGIFSETAFSGTVDSGAGSTSDSCYSDAVWSADAFYDQLCQLNGGNSGRYGTVCRHV